MDPISPTFSSPVCLRSRYLVYVNILLDLGVNDDCAARQD
jgi:hypothetical protein